MSTLGFPGGGSAGAGGAGKPGGPTAAEERPEVVRYVIVAWAIMLSGELVRLMVDVALSLADPASLKEEARKAAKRVGEPASENLVNLSAYLSVGVAAMFSLLLLLVMVWALTAYAQRKKWAETARRMLAVLSGFFALRMLMVFMVVPSAYGGPTALLATGGVVQIIIGVVGVCAIMFATQDEARKWSEPADEAKGSHNRHTPSSI
ncbi:hypothetical protein [Corynebacterium aquatimens]|uniref:Uncharacterized protein n=1 Tax=Corynebacterium aquatimens TaxID=1190508 RepID=A0A931DVU2_9CORY|nr:hypothetical protein [Corynebacterium aquatimens]MBG6122454.1 hypothetical protein [Corynebacterium aquatimens]WJY65006.1 hypothetical protein CAQUA_01335 [Corynebacterium aquatimens]